MTDLIDEINQNESFKEMTTRYPKECSVLAFLAHRQLNSDKNKIKPPIEDMNYAKLLDKCTEELREIRHEIFSDQYFEKDKIDKHRALEEIGDLVGMLAGLLAKVLKEK